MSLPPRAGWRLLSAPRAGWRVFAPCHAGWRVLLNGSAIAALALPGAAIAQVVTLDPVSLQSEDEQSGAADRATSQYVSEAELDRARTGDLKDLFAGIASVSVGGAMPIAQKIFVNGVDMLNLAVTIDGVAQNNRAFHHVSANAIDPGLLKAVRADAGVAAADAGPHAMAGSVVFETIDAADMLEDGRNLGGELRLSYGDNGNVFTRALTLAGRQGGFEWLGYLKGASGKDYQTGDGRTIAGSAADLQSGLLKFAYESPEGHRIELSGQRLRDDALRPYRANMGGVTGGRPVPETRRYDTTRDSVSLSYENTLATGLWDPKVVLGFSQSLVNVPDPWGSEGTSATRALTVQNTFHLSDIDRIVVGLDTYRRNGRYEGPGDRFEETARNVGLFAQGRLEPLAGLKASFGLRADRQRFEGINGWHDTNTGMSGNASLSYLLTPDLTVRAGWSSVFGGIGIEDNYTFDPVWDYTGLRASRGENLVAGLDWQAGALAAGDLKLGAEVFRTRIDHARGGTGTFDFESRGFNLGATFGWDSGFARLTYTNSKAKVGGAPSDSYTAQDFGAPIGQVLAFEMQQQIGDAWLVGGNLDVALDYNDVPAGAELPIEGYQVVSVFAEYAVAAMPGLRLRAEINNLFDEEYADRATYGADFASVTPLSEPGRTVSLSLISKF